MRRIRKPTRLVLLLVLLLVLHLCISISAAEPASPAWAASPWAAEALTFADTADILPPEADVTASATRAEFAYMVTRLLQLNVFTPLDAFPDADETHPYAQALQQAVALGLLNGSDGLLLPDQPITREQGFTVLARAFALEDGDVADLSHFLDRQSVSSWAVPATAALVQCGAVQGSFDMLHPRDNITIEELAQLLLNLAGRVCTEGSGSTAILPAGSTIGVLKDAVIDGDLYLCRDAGTSATLIGLTVHGRLVIRGSGTITLRNVSADSIVLCDAGATLCTAGNEHIHARAAVKLDGGAATVIADDGITLRHGKYASLRCAGNVVTSDDAVIINATLTGANAALNGTGTAETVTVTHPDCLVGIRAKQILEQYPVPAPAAPQTVIETIRVQATFPMGAGLFSDMYLKNYIGWVNEGTTVTYVNYLSDVSACVELPDGSQGWVAFYALDISQDNYVRETDYTTAEKESYVNQNGYSSATPYLVWVSLKCQRVNVFLGSAGNWKLANSFICATGKNSTPTIAGVFAYSVRQPRWDFGDYYVQPVLIFNGGHAFHSRTYTPSGNLLDARLGVPVSAGCVRMQDADVNWLDQYLPLCSTVVVY